MTEQQSRQFLGYGVTFLQVLYPLLVAVPYVVAVAYRQLVAVTETSSIRPSVRFIFSCIAALICACMQQTAAIQMTARVTFLFMETK